MSKKSEEDETLDEKFTPPKSAFCKLGELCLKSTFPSKWKILGQENEAVMGSTLSPIVANLFVKLFEQEALSIAKGKPKL